MDLQYLVMIAVAFITAVGGWVGNHISNKPKRDEMHMNQINLIITRYESFNEILTKENVRLKEEKRVLQEKVTTLEKRVQQLEGGE